MNSHEISVIIPVLHEEETINPCIENLFSHTPDFFIQCIVIDGDPHRSTVQTIERSDVSRLASEPGRGIQMNAGFREATGDIIVFLHADTRLPRNGLLLIGNALADPSISAGAFSLGVETESRLIRSIAFLTTIRSRLTRIPYGDQVIFIRRDAFEALGGFREIPIMEDLDLMRRLRKRGYRIRILRERVLSSPRRWEREGVLKCTIRNWRIRTAYLMGADPERLVSSYRPQ